MTRTASQDEFQEPTGKDYTRWREHRRKASEIRDEMPDLSEALLEEYAEKIDKIADIARRSLSV